MSALRHHLSVAAFPFLLATLSAIACYRFAGPTLGLFLGLLVFLTAFVPPFTAAERTWQDRLTTLPAILLPFCLTWLVASRHNEMRLIEWASSSLVLITFALALSGLSAALSVTRIGRHAAAALVVVLGLAWLTWPIWLSPTWNGEASAGWVGNLVTIHPGLAFSQPHLGHWVEQSVAYHLTDLNQNVPYSPPRTVLLCVILHALLGAGLLALAAWTERPEEVTVTPDIAPSPTPS